LSMRWGRGPGNGLMVDGTSFVDGGNKEKGSFHF